MKILLVINPISGNSDKMELLNRVKRKMTAKDHLIVYKTTGKGDKKAIAELITKKTLDRILVAGGDGTVKLVAEAMPENEISIGILPAGSANGLARDLNLPTAPEDFIAIALGNTIKEIDTIDINGQLGLHISDFGLNAELIREYNQSNFRGIFGYALNSIPTLFQNKGPYPFQIRTENETFERNAIMVAIANSKQFGTGAYVNRTGKIDDGIFEVLVFKKFDVLEILKTLNLEVELSAEFVEVIPTKSVKISCPSPVAFQIDGEYCDMLTEVKAHIHPKKLKIACASNTKKNEESDEC